MSKKENYLVILVMFPRSVRHFFLTGTVEQIARYCHVEYIASMNNQGYFIRYIPFFDRTTVTFEDISKITSYPSEVGY